MPCFTATEIQVDGSKMNAERLEKVIKNLNLPAGIAYLKNGNFIILGSDTQRAERTKKMIVQEYSAQVIREASKRFGWTVKTESKNKTGLNQINLVRR